MGRTGGRGALAGGERPFSVSVKPVTQQPPLPPFLSPSGRPAVPSLLVLLPTAAPRSVPLFPRLPSPRCKAGTPAPALGAPSTSSPAILTPPHTHTEQSLLSGQWPRGHQHHGHFGASYSLALLCPPSRKFSHGCGFGGDTHLLPSALPVAVGHSASRCPHGHAPRAPLGALSPEPRPLLGAPPPSPPAGRLAGVPRSPNPQAPAFLWRPSRHCQPSGHHHPALPSQAP